MAGPNLLSWGVLLVVYFGWEEWGGAPIHRFKNSLVEALTPMTSRV